jgi:hypothetical protein
MKRQILPIVISGLIVAGIMPTLVAIQNQPLENIDSQILVTQPEAWNTIYETSFTSYDEWDTGSSSGPDLWHITTVDAWEGDESLGCFSIATQHYVNNMNFNYAIGPTLDMQGVYVMVMDFYCKYITENSNDYWGICLYDPSTDNFLSHIWTAPNAWQHLPYDTYGYHPEWMGPMQPMSEYQSFDIKAAYDHWFDLGYFRNGDGSRSYSLRIGFMMYQTDALGYTNVEADANGDYWSGLFIDDVEIRQLAENQQPLTPGQPSGPTTLLTGESYTFSTQTTDPNDDPVRFGWDWDGDGIVDEVTAFVASGETKQTSHTWTAPGTYSVKVKAEDDKGAESSFSPALVVTVSENNPPLKPSLTGPSQGKQGNSYTFYGSTTDPEGNQVYYLFDWDDGTNTGWIGPYASGQSASASHSWDTQGSYGIKVKSKDTHDAEGVWSDPVSFSVPRSRTFSLFTHLMEQYPLLASLWRTIFL